VQAAIDAIPAGNTDAITIRLHPGTYHERIELPKDKSHVRFVGGGADASETVLTFDLNAKSVDAGGKPIGTGKSASTFLRADDVTAENLTFANATPRDVAQALAISAEGDRQAFYRCRFLGWQDTIYTGPGRKYFQDCYVEGGVDYVFGPAVAVFNRCELRSKRSGYVTAASTPRELPFGYVFLNCRLTANEDVADGSCYLGRPWRDFASVTFIECHLGRHINPAGWSKWNVPERFKDARYAEYRNTGPGARPETRVPWSRQLTDDEAKAITIDSVLAGGDHWDPQRKP
jgi:pectinesterase